MKVKTEQFKFDLGMLAQQVEKHTKEVLQHLLDTGKSLNGVTVVNDDHNMVVINTINPDLSLNVKQYDDIDGDEAFDISVYTIDIYEQLQLLDYIAFNILKQG